MAETPLPIENYFGNYPRFIVNHPQFYPFVETNCPFIAGHNYICCKCFCIERANSFVQCCKIMDQLSCFFKRFQDTTKLFLW